MNYTIMDLNKLYRKTLDFTFLTSENVNTTNVLFAWPIVSCNFYRVPGHPESYSASIAEYKRKINKRSTI